MLILMILEFSKGYLEPIWHEVFGVLLLILFIIHLILNKSYIKNIPKGEYKNKRTIMLFINIGFFITFLLSVLFGLLISQELFKFLNVHNYGITKLHKIISYISILLLGLHLGINFNSLFGKLEKIIKHKIIKYIISILIIGYGIYSFIKLKLLSHIIGTYQYGLIDGNIIINIIRYFSVVMMLSIIINYIYKKIK